MEQAIKIYADRDYVDSKGLPDGAGAYQQLVTNADGNPKWNNHGYMRTKETFTYDGDYAKTDSAASGGTTNTLYASLFTLAKISDYVPTAEELFSDETTAIFESGEVGVDIPDLKHVYDGYYGRFKFTKVPSTATNPCSEDGLFPGIVVVTKPSLVFEVFDCYEPGIYIWTSSLGKKYATKSLTINKIVPIDSSVPYVKQAFVGQTVVVKAVNENGKPTEWEVVDTAPTTTDPNMQLVTDSNGNTVWQERTHYEGDLIESVVIAETTHDFTEDQFWYAMDELTLDMTGGKTYAITWDGVEYERTVIDTGWGTTYIGNGYVYEITDDTGEPFLMLDEGGGLVVCSAGDNAFAEHTFSVTERSQHIEKLDEKFLPESVITVNSISEHTVGSKYYVDGNAMGEIFNGYDSNTTASGYHSHAEGFSTSADGDSSHAEGNATTASGLASHAEGSNTIASGHYSHVEGIATQASATGAHAEGDGTIASGASSHAEGKDTEASGVHSHAEGLGTIANNDIQHVQGMYNLVDNSVIYLHIVGNGTANARSNAHTLDWNGNAWYAGSIEGTAMILKSSTEGNTKRFKITVDDSGTITATEVTD